MQKYEITADTLPLKALLKGAGHKYSHGHALVVSGGFGRSGAARLAARGALRIGAGLVTLAVPASALVEVAAQITAIMMKEVSASAQLEEHLRDDRINALCLGPGLGVCDNSAAMISTALTSDRSVVLDADALTLIAQDRALFSRLHHRCVLTPHKGEFTRLFPDISERLDTGPPIEKARAAVDAARRAGCVVLFKGENSVVARPNGSVGVHSAQGPRAAPWLATAGSGDVLAGFITGLIARGFSPFQAAELGAYLHVEAAIKFGPALIAEDLPEQMAPVFRHLQS